MSPIIMLGEKRGEIYRNGELEINVRLWDIMKQSFDELFDDEVQEGEDVKPILDACCGSRMFWFDRQHENSVYMDNRTIDTTLCDGRKLIINPDVVADFRRMPFKDDQFSLVVFDPPHLKNIGDGAWMAKKYGKLSGDWRSDLKQGFAECWRVLKMHGTLIFKWNEEQIPLKEILKLAPCKPLFGNRRSKTHWVVFFKEVAHD